MPTRLDLAGQIFTNLIARCLENGKWLCGCVCGGTIVASAGDLRAGNVKSCGCAGVAGRFTSERVKERHLQDLEIEHEGEIWQAPQLALERLNEALRQLDLKDATISRTRLDTWSLPDGSCSWLDGKPIRVHVAPKGGKPVRYRPKIDIDNAIAALRKLANSPEPIDADPIERVAEVMGIGADLVRAELKLLLKEPVHVSAIAKDGRRYERSFIPHVLVARILRRRTQRHKENLERQRRARKRKEIITDKKGRRWASPKKGQNYIRTSKSSFRKWRDSNIGSPMLDGHRTIQTWQVPGANNKPTDYALFDDLDLINNMQANSSEHFPGTTPIAEALRLLGMSSRTLSRDLRKLGLKEPTETHNRQAADGRALKYTYLKHAAFQAVAKLRGVIIDFPRLCRPNVGNSTPRSVPKERGPKIKPQTAAKYEMCHDAGKLFSPSEVLEMVNKQFGLGTMNDTEHVRSFSHRFRKKEKRYREAARIYWKNQGETPLHNSLRICVT